MRDEGKPPARIGLALAGAASLGAYQAGALAALVEGLRPLAAPGTTGEPPVLEVDLMTGASSGALNALLAAHCLVHGRDAVTVLRRAWVEEASLTALANRRFDAPLSLAGLAHLTDELLDTVTPRALHVPAVAAVEVELAVTSLHGFVEPVDDGQHGEPSYRGRRRFTVHPGTAGHELAHLVAAALASAANPLGFPPAYLTGQESGGERAAPGWHSDGGLLDHTLARAVALADERAAGAPEDRLLVVVHPFTSRLPDGREWWDPAAPPSWSATLLRALDIQQSQLFADDVRALHAHNARVAQLDEARAALADLDPAAVAPALARLGLPADAGPGALVDEVARRAGLDRTRPVHLAVISPDLLQGLPEERPILSGDLLAGMGGFVARSLRASDFDLGYRCTLEWLAADRLPVLPGLTAEARRQALTHAQDAYRPTDDYLVTGGTALRALGPSALGRLVRTGLHAVGVLVRDLAR